MRYHRSQFHKGYHNLTVLNLENHNILNVMYQIKVSNSIFLEKVVIMHEYISPKLMNFTDMNNFYFWYKTHIYKSQTWYCMLVRSWAQSSSFISTHFKILLWRHFINKIQRMLSDHPLNIFTRLHWRHFFFTKTGSVLKETICGYSDLSHFVPVKRLSRHTAP